MSKPGARDEERANQNPIAKKAAETWLKKFKSTKFNVDRRVGLSRQPPDQHWTAQDEDTIQQEWDGSNEKKVMESIIWNNYSQFQSLWKVCLRLLKCTPDDIISPMTSMRYLPAPTARGLSSRYIYHRDFCVALSSMITHPFMRGLATRVIMCLQWAIICRTDDRDTPLIQDEHTDRCLAFKAAENDLQNAGQVNKSRLQIIREAFEGTRGKKSQLTQLLIDIGDVALSKTYNLATPSQEHGVRRHLTVMFLTMEDVNNVQEAIDNLAWSSETMLTFGCTTVEAFRSWRLISKGEEKPSVKEIKDFFERSHKRMLRECYLRANGREDGTASPEGNATDEDEEEPENSNVGVNTNNQGEEPRAPGRPRSRGAARTSSSSALMSQEGLVTTEQLKVLKDELVRKVRVRDTAIADLVDANKRLKEEATARDTAIADLVDANKRLKEEATSRDTVMTGLTEENKELRNDVTDLKRSFDELMNRLPQVENGRGNDLLFNRLPSQGPEGDNWDDQSPQNMDVDDQEGIAYSEECIADEVAKVNQHMKGTQGDGHFNDNLGDVWVTSRKDKDRMGYLNIVDK